ncbi:TetR family transcriptional regulator [Modestobacter sp. I12A-02628]|uniref:TetR/AcrR family transcriptional regulator n=1 Tax=Goekera deserti TaxID=2497753 RepID=A0A7K3WGV3_9ACTN|nr:TetR/AcrR family transcriptional regulator [Goekera deserti]MPQ97857.1 TetR family transcriptional regulator [Goekera deserti]NDI48502.1 TetR family transcriptional regulator [Goekera deserti]NEL55119.1 TetR/AcrR family transcriptional regulator [Goekera deserti]
MSAVAHRRDRRDSRWDEHRRARREQLVEATVAAVARHGAGVGMDEIAVEAGTSKTAVYRHFADRSDLHLAVCTRVAEQLTQALGAAMSSSGPPRAMMASALETYLAFIEASPELYRFVVHPPAAERRESGTGQGDPISTLSDMVGGQAAALLAGSLAAAGRDTAAAEPWGHGIVGLVRSAGDRWLQAGRPMPRAELAAHLTDLAWSGISGVLGPAVHANHTTTTEEQ